MTVTRTSTALVFGMISGAMMMAGCSDQQQDGASASAAAPPPVEQRAQVESYDPLADPAAQYEHARAVARDEGKQVLLVFGADWCPDCRILSAELKSPPLADLINERYVVEKIHVGRKDANTAFTAQFDDPAANGIPSIVIVNPDGSTVTRTDAGELAAIRKMNSDQVYAWFKALPTR